MTDSDHLQSFQCRLHWIMFIKPFLILAIPIMFEWMGVHQKYVFLVFLGIYIAWLLAEWVRYQFTYLEIKPQNVVFQSGFLVQQTIDLPMRKIESIDIRQSLIASIFNYGDIVITGSGGTRQIIVGINNPLTCRRYIEQYMHASAHAE